MRLQPQLQDIASNPPHCDWQTRYLCGTDAVLPAQIAHDGSLLINSCL